MAFSNSLATGIRLYITTFVVISLTSVASAQTDRRHNKVVVCYLSSWAVYRPGKGQYTIDKFDPSLCTHVIYAFAGLDSTQSAIKSLDPWQDLKEDFGKGGYERLTGLKKTYPHLKVSLAIGGWNEGSKNFSILASDRNHRERFAKQVTSFIRRYGFDGLDFNWEYPTKRGGLPMDRENFVLLIKELREKFDTYNLLLTIAMAAQIDIIDVAFDVRQLSKYLDFFHIQSYDYHGSWDKEIGFNAPLTANAGDMLNVQYSIEYLIKIGAPPSKLVLGLPFYGRSFKTTFEGAIGDDTDGASFQGPFTHEEGYLGYNEICLMLSNKTSGWTSSWDAKASEVIARSKKDDDGLTRVVIFDSPRSIANKVMFAMRKSLAGVSAWAVDTDDFLGECELTDDTFKDYNLFLNIIWETNSTYPLLRKIDLAIYFSLKEIEMEQQLEQEKEKQLIQQAKERLKQQSEQYIYDVEDMEMEQQVEASKEHQASGQPEKPTRQESKQQAKQPAKLQIIEPTKENMEHLICFLSKPKRCFVNE